MFVDRVSVKLKAGNGGNGIVSFRREAHVPLGGPNGGDGGNGGSIYFVVDTNKSTLLDLRYNKKIVAKNGENGKSKKMHGAKGADVYVKVPQGTLIKDANTNELICDLCQVDQSYEVCKGGKGGRGNYHFASGKDNAPEYAEQGTLGESKDVILELKLLADVGVIGLPNAGKSTFISCVTNCKAEIGDYAFTTIVPNLGVAKIGDDSFVIADMPGLIKGAHLGKGLGLMFLRHIERCRVLVHMVDMSREDPYQDYLDIKDELNNYGMHLLDRPEIVVASKMDEEGSEEKLKEFESKLNKPVIPISCISEENLDKVLYKCVELLKDAPIWPVYKEEDKEEVFNLNDEEDIFDIVKRKEGYYEIIGDRVIRTYNLINISTDEGMLRLLTYLNKIGVDEKLHEIGARTGDTVKIADFEFEYYE